MEWVNLHISTQLRHPSFVGSSPAERGTWLSVLAYACSIECGGRLEGAATWRDRQWQQAAGVTLREVKSAYKLLAIDGEDIIINGYPDEREREIQQKRNAGSAKTDRKAMAARMNGVKGGRKKPNENPTEEPNETEQKNPTDNPTPNPTEPIEGEGEGEGELEGEGEVARVREIIPTPCVGDTEVVAAILLDPMFHKIFFAYPAGRRGTAPRAIAQIFAGLDPPPVLADVLAALQQYSNSDEWQREKGRFVPRMARWIESRAWEGAAQCKPRREWKTKTTAAR